MNMSIEFYAKSLENWHKKCIFFKKVALKKKEIDTFSTIYISEVVKKIKLLLSRK